MTRSSDLNADSGTSSDHIVGTITSSLSCETVASSPLDLAVNSNEMGSERQDLYVERKKNDCTGSLSTDGLDCSGNVTLMASDNEGLTQVEEEETEEEKPGNYWSANDSRVFEVSTRGGSSRALDSSLDLSSPDDPNAEVERNGEGDGDESWNACAVQNLLIPVTENDPLGVFNRPLGNPPPTNANVSQSNDDNAIVVSGQRPLLSDVRLFAGTEAMEGENKSGRNGVILCEEVGRPSSEVEPSQSISVSEESIVAIRRPKSSSSRGEMFGSVMRTAATRLFSKYNDIKKSIVTQGTKIDSGSLSSINSLGSLDPTITNSPSTAASESSDGDRASSDDRESTGVATGYDSVVMTPPKSRLRVPGLYAPLGK